MEKLQACSSCGAMVPERQDPPYPGHKKDCALVKSWTNESAFERLLKESECGFSVCQKCNGKTSCTTCNKCVRCSGHKSGCTCSSASDVDQFAAFESLVEEDLTTSVAKAYSDLGKTLPELVVGTRVMCHGFPGVVSKVLDGQLDGMVEIKFDSGSGIVCVGISQFFQGYPGDYVLESKKTMDLTPFEKACAEHDSATVKRSELSKHRGTIVYSTLEAIPSAFDFAWSADGGAKIVVFDEGAYFTYEKVAEGYTLYSSTQDGRRLKDKANWAIENLDVIPLRESKSKTEDRQYRSMTYCLKCGSAGIPVPPVTGGALPYRCPVCTYSWTDADTISNEILGEVVCEEKTGEGYDHSQCTICKSCSGHNGSHDPRCGGLKESIGSGCPQCGGIRNLIRSDLTGLQYRCADCKYEWVEPS